MIPSNNQCTCHKFWERLVPNPNQAQLRARRTELINRDKTLTCTFRKPKPLITRKSTSTHTSTRGPSGPSRHMVSQHRESIKTSSFASSNKFDHVSLLQGPSTNDVVPSKEIVCHLYKNDANFDLTIVT